MRAIGLLGLVLLIVMHLFLYGETSAEKNQLDSNVRVNYVLPAEFSKVAALDFEGLAADFQLLQGIFFIGDKIERSELIDTDDWDYFTRIIKVVISLDPYFYDTYHLATGMLTWGSGRYEDAIDILETARHFNPKDYRFPYHIGFIYFYFLDDAQKGAQYFELASRIPDAPPLLASLASRLAYYKGNYKFSIDLLERMLSSERSPEIRQYYEQRLDALRGALIIEKAIQKYKVKYSRLPTSLQELQAAKLLETLPQDPYGGEYIILKNGRVYSTSKFARAHSKKNLKTESHAE
jgi:tetratricopeptide (TPR) repeat protein